MENLEKTDRMPEEKRFPEWMERKEHIHNVGRPRGGIIQTTCRDEEADDSDHQHRQTTDPQHFFFGCFIFANEGLVDVAGERGRGDQ